MTAAISLQDVSKRFRKYDDTTIGGALVTRTRRSWLWALSEVNIDVQPGESVGVIGRNGAGKSTLLQLLCGVTAPTRGRIEVRGRVAPLISVGVGFHPEMTGRENIQVNGTILGMSKPEIDKRFDSIVEFAELARFIDTPVKFYSSGMFVRLGFAVAIAAEPDILLVDEVLAVGDVAFQLKCFERMSQIRASGTTIVVVSHSMNSIRGFCDRGIVMDEGRVVHDGGVFQAISCYYDLLGDAIGDDTAEDTEDADQDALEIVSFELIDPTGRPGAHFQSGSEVTVRIGVRAAADIDDPFAWIGIETETAIPVYSATNMGQPFPSLRAGQVATYEVVVPARLTTGSYQVGASIRRATGVGKSRLLKRCPPMRFYVSGHGHVHGVVDLGARFELADSR